MRKSGQNRGFIIFAIAAIIFLITPEKDKNRIFQNLMNSINGAIVKVK